jgi:uncharacterized membrane protein YccC
MLIVLVTLVLAPFMSNYWFMNLILFCTLFAYGYFASKTAGTTFWMLGTLLFVSAVVALNAQEPVPFVAIINSYLGVMIGLTIGVTLSRVLWPALPQKALREAITRFCQVAAAVLDEKSEGSMAGLKSTLAALPLEIARTTAALGVNPLLRQEQAKRNALVPLLMSLSAQLPRLASVRTHLEGSQELKRYLCALHQEFGAWLEGLGHFFRRPDRKKALPPLRGIIERLQQKMEGPNPAEGLHPSSRGLSPKTLMEVGEYLVAAELLQRCGEMASDLQLAEYWGDYFL